MNKVELLAPAGNMECLRTALYFGADAVYLAGKKYGLRAFADNFTMEELSEAVRLAHDLGKKIYVTVNALFRPSELDGLEEYLTELRTIGVDAVIVSDPGVIVIARKVGIEVHLSTQASTMNHMSAAFWHAQGVKRVVMAREASLQDIEYIRKNTPETMEIEAFVHGAMCIAYSGRCLLSSIFTGRSGNKGACAQPCRWEYTIKEAGYPDDVLPIMEDERGTYVLNSKDLMMIEHIPELINAGVISFKLEGRMKSAYYVASVVNAYRRAIDQYYADPDHYQTDPELAEELRLSGSRKFTTGFYYGNPRGEGQDIVKELNDRSRVFCGIVNGGRNEEGLLHIEQRNRFFVGEELIVLSPKYGFKRFTVTDIINMDGERQDAAPHPQQQLWINCPLDLQPGDILRVER